MPKLKTRKAIAKRVTITRKKKALRSKAGRRHILSYKKRKRKRNLRRKGTVSHAQKNLIRKALPYGG